MHHVALDRAWPNDCHFNHDIVKTFWFHPRQRGHLSAALYLENADRIRALHDFESRRIIFRNVCQIERATAFPAKLQGVLHYGHHSKPEQINLHNAQIFAIVLVPLRNDTARH